MTIRRIQIIAETVRKLVIPVTAVVFLIETILWQGSLNRPEKMQSRRATRLTRRQEQRTDGESRQSSADTYQAQRAMEEDHTYQRSQSAEMEDRTNNMDAIRSQGQRNDAAEADQEQNTGASQVQDLRSDDRPSQDLSALDSGQRRAESWRS